MSPVCGIFLIVSRLLGLLPVSLTYCGSLKYPLRALLKLLLVSNSFLLARSSSALCCSGSCGARRPAASSSSFISLATSLQHHTVSQLVQQIDSQHLKFDSLIIYKDWPIDLQLTVPVFDRPTVGQSNKCRGRDQRRLRLLFVFFIDRVSVGLFSGAIMRISLNEEIR